MKGSTQAFLGVFVFVFGSQFVSGDFQSIQNKVYALGILSLLAAAIACFFLWRKWNPAYIIPALPFLMLLIMKEDQLCMSPIGGKCKVEGAVMEGRRDEKGYSRFSSPVAEIDCMGSPESVSITEETFNRIVFKENQELQAYVGRIGFRYYR